MAGPTSFRNLDIFPKRDDLLSDDKLDIKANIINGAYPSVEHYLDLQFKLLREDFFGPIREGIGQYMQNPKKTKFENIRVYPEVCILSTYMKNNKIGHLVDIAFPLRLNKHPVDCRDLAQDKQLMFGSLLLFTKNNFDTILCATVLDSETNLLAEGHLAVLFQNPVADKDLKEVYLMVESEVFFEPYHKVLKVLQSYRSDYLPMQRYIIGVQTVTRTPAYLAQRTMYTLEDNRKRPITFHILDQNQWPSASSIGLDTAQMEAYKFALTKEFAVIQGPPGAGKTFIGVKIATTLLRNYNIKGRPMAIICYTNHALDQFLEGILPVTNDVVRLGGQSKSKILEPYTLNNLKTKYTSNNLKTRKKSKNSFLYAKKRSELKIIFNLLTSLQSEIMHCEKELIEHKYLTHVLRTKLDNLYKRRHYLLEESNRCKAELNEITTDTEYELLKTARVVGMTTTAAASKTDLLKKLFLPIVIVEEAAEVLEAHIVASLTNDCKHLILIVIVEEAAEVLEAHIVASLTNDCKHLILIGDHKQLRPSAAHYKLAKHYNLEISLFERMIRNGVQARTLTTQRRMRPTFVELLVPMIYERLDSHPNVYNYPNVKGMKDSLYFFTHNAFEDSQDPDGSRSHKNIFEAKWCVALANYLRKMNYTSKEITILSTYTAQVSLIKELSKKYKSLQDVKVTSVDNYQGEENRIVILSLVRSNRHGKIGFLATENRVCVALSRAKEGFYIFGNMKVLQSASSLWRAINKKLLTLDAVGNKLRVCCDFHKDVVLEVSRADVLNDCTSGSCLRICKDMGLQRPKEDMGPITVIVWYYILYIVCIIREVFRRLRQQHEHDFFDTD